MANLPAREHANDQSVKSKIAKLSKEIKQLHFDKSWKWDEIALWLSERDIKITEGTLKLYYYTSGRRKSKPKAESTAGLASETAADTTTPPLSVPATSQRPAPTGRVNPVLD